MSAAIASFIGKAERLPIGRKDARDANAITISDSARTLIISQAGSVRHAAVYTPLIYFHAAAIFHAQVRLSRFSGRYGTPVAHAVTRRTPIL